MKKILVIAAIAVVSATTSQAQSFAEVSTSKDTLNNADTVVVTFTNIKSHVKSFQITVSKVNGTVSGKVYLEGTVNGTAWVRLDSLVNVDQAVNTKVFPISSTSYNSYRAWYGTTSGSQKSILQFAYVRRQDE